VPEDLLIRPYRPADERDWVRCRVLSFLSTAYFDDIATSRPRCDEPSIELVAERAGVLVGVLDLALPDDPAKAATVETVAVHPDHQGRGTATALHEAARLAAGRCAQVEAWTRDDEGTLRWYATRGMVEDSHYLHVYVDWDEAVAPEGDQIDGLRLVKGFFHCTDMAREAELRRRFRRVHVCRRMVAPRDALR